MSAIPTATAPRAKQELLGRIEEYRQGLLPPIVPLTLLEHHLSRYPVLVWVHQQVFPASASQGADAAQSRVDLG